MSEGSKIAIGLPRYMEKDKNENAFKKYKIPKSSLYNIIQYSKFGWLEKVADKNYFNSEYFLWVDAGLSRFFYDINLNNPYPGENAKQSLMNIKDSILIQVFLLLAAGVAFFGVNLPKGADKWLLLLALLVLGSACSTVLGIAFSVVPKSGRGASAVVSPIVIILQFFSGVFFVFTSLPNWMQQFAAIFPLKWLTQGMRSVFLPEEFATQEVAGNWELGKTALVISVWLVLGLIFAIKSFKWSRE